MAADGFAAARLFDQSVSYTYDDVIFLPGYIDFPADAIDLSTRLSRRLPLSIPCVAYPMDTVSEASMAALGGAAVIHCNDTATCQAATVRVAKARRIPFVTPGSVTKGTVPDFGPAPYALVSESGGSKSTVVGIVAKSDWEALADKNSTVVAEYMRPAPTSVPVNYDFEKAASFLAGGGL